MWFLLFSNISCEKLKNMLKIWWFMTSTFYSIIGGSENTSVATRLLLIR